jgi:hypothetical protein
VGFSSLGITYSSSGTTALLGHNVVTLNIILRVSLCGHKSPCDGETDRSTNTIKQNADQNAMSAYGGRPKTGHVHERGGCQRFEAHP